MKRCRAQSIKKSPRAFTLVESLIVIAIIAILAALLLPSLSHGKQQAQGMKCLSNLNQMALAWTAYANDFNQDLVINRGDQHLNPDDYYDNWAAGDVSELPDETNAALLSDSLLGPYVKNVAVEACPADPGNPSGTPRVRSISMNNYMNGIGIAIFSNNFVNNTRLSQVTRPANSFVFLDENATTINDCYFAVIMTTNYFFIQVLDMPANYHNLAGGFAFADGHGEMKKWLTALFQKPPLTDTARLAPQNADCIWLMQNTTTPIGQ